MKNIMDQDQFAKFIGIETVAWSQGEAHGKTALAINANIDFFKACTQGELRAQAVEVSINHKLATYNVTITNDDKDIIASFRGTAYRKKQSN